MTDKRSETCLYPFVELSDRDEYPDGTKFEVIHTHDGRGAGIRTRTPFERGERLCKVSGQIVASRRLHTLQINENVHLYDPHFTGLLLHSCDPNVFLNMVDMELWALKHIEPGELLTMDYASTETVLSRQFACQCGAPNCRGWIAGSKESPHRPDGTLTAVIGDTATICEAH
ncbi:SET domain-containing protein-lysine N-methyltransferase [Paraburkholderia sp. Tr-20389]|uniref:SET domain-containing protein-lysine N-methyltransferase n=1 Tax=Paraburkholderia sp. Tr-20389 TaxID=2703903 RepID=UPI0019801803|nr:SET domain-containing protein-lysine N-methyltransferase [Paraburkholderia sp. Tr-20389]